MLNQIKAKIEAQLKREGVDAEVTFISATMFSVLCQDAAQHAKSKGIMTVVAGVQFDSEDCDDECGHCAYYKY